MMNDVSVGSAIIVIQKNPTRKREYKLIHILLFVSLHVLQRSTLYAHSRSVAYDNGFSWLEHHTMSRLLHIISAIERGVSKKLNIVPFSILKSSAYNVEEISK